MLMRFFIIKKKEEEEDGHSLGKYMGGLSHQDDNKRVGAHDYGGNSCWNKNNTDNGEMAQVDISQGII